MSTTGAKILIVDDEPDILEFLRYNMVKEGFEVFTAGNGIEGIKLAKQHKPDLIILDVMMPEMDGIEACRRIREEKSLSHTLIIFLTARSEDFTELAAFDAGADDYVSKPIRPRILLSRIHALLRRKSGEKIQGTIHVGDLEINREKYLVSKNGVQLDLPRKEFELLSLLASKPGKVFTRQDILAKVWGQDVYVGDRTIDVHIRKIREKIGEESIHTVKGIGYKFELL